MVQYLPVCPMKRFVKCFFELLTQIIVKVRKCKAVSYTHLTLPTILRV